MRSAGHGTCSAVTGRSRVAWKHPRR